MGTNYHNEVLRKARIIERQQVAKAARQARGAVDYDETSSDNSYKILAEIKHRDAIDKLQHLAQSETGGYSNVCGVERERQTYDHSRKGPIRDDSKRYIKLEINSLAGRGPNDLYKVWKG